MLAIVVVWLGLGLSALGAVTLVRPVRILGIPTRRRAASVVLVGVALAALGLVLPAPERQVARVESRLDAIVPRYQFHEFHETIVEASPDEVYRAIRAVTAEEIQFFRTLTTLRRFGQPGPESILNAPESKPILDVATSTTFLLLAEDPGQEIVVGTLVAAPPGFRRESVTTAEDYANLEGSGFAKAVMNFRVEREGAGVTRVTTETRVFATDDASRRRFAAYWRVIYPGSALIRRMWLAAIRSRAETIEARSRFPDGSDTIPNRSRASQSGSPRACEETPGMMTHVEYLGFKAREANREYSLRVRVVGVADRDFTLVIANEAFIAQRVRYQDAPEICFLKLQRELTACAEGSEPARRMKVTDADLEAYRVAHSPKPRLHALKPVGSSSEGA